MCVKHCASELEFHKTHVFNLFLLLLLLYPFVIILCFFSSLSLPLPPFTRLLQCYVPIKPVVFFHPATPLSNTCRAFTFNHTIYSTLHLLSSAPTSLSSFVSCIMNDACSCNFASSSPNCHQHTTPRRHALSLYTHTCTGNFA